MHKIKKIKTSTKLFLLYILTVILLASANFIYYVHQAESMFEKHKTDIMRYNSSNYGNKKYSFNFGGSVKVKVSDEK